MQRLARILSGLGSPRILVLGDLILDRYIEGAASRVSPEAPVLVFEKQDERFLLGGACNVAANLVSMGARPSVLGVVGDDEVALRMREQLALVGIDAERIVTDPTRPTTVKIFVNKESMDFDVQASYRNSYVRKYIVRDIPNP